MRPIFKYSIVFSLIIQGAVHGADLPVNSPGLDPGDKTAPPNTYTTANTTNTKGVSTITVPINGVLTPINITINRASNAPVASPEPKLISSKEPISKPNITNTITIPPTPSLDIMINKKYYNSPKIRKLYRMLGIKHSPRVIHLVADKNLANVKDSIIYINIRSFVSVLAYLSNSVQVLPSMLQQKLVIAPKNPDGTYFNLNLLTKGLLFVHISSKKPQCDVSVKVFYRNYWFYIKDSDYKSKRTFSMIGQLFNLKAGEIKGQVSPILTIPVSTSAESTTSSSSTSTSTITTN